ncbi:biotin/lipoyl-containing protein, partial [Streptococcus sobrinus]
MAVEIIMPKLGVDMSEGEIIEWEKQEGDRVNQGDILLEIMSDKTNMELEAEESGILLKIVHPAGDTVPVTEVIGYIGEEGEVIEDIVEKSKAPLAANQTEPTSEPQGNGGKVRATPAARKMARDLGIDLGRVSGTGPKGRV